MNNLLLTDWIRPPVHPSADPAAIPAVDPRLAGDLFDTALDMDELQTTWVFMPAEAMIQLPQGDVTPPDMPTEVDSPPVHDAEVNITTDSPVFLPVAADAPATMAPVMPIPTAPTPTVPMDARDHPTPRTVPTAVPTPTDMETTTAKQVDRDISTPQTPVHHSRMPPPDPVTSVMRDHTADQMPSDAVPPPPVHTEMPVDLPPAFVAHPMARVIPDESHRNEYTPIVSTTRPIAEPAVRPAPNAPDATVTEQPSITPPTQRIAMPTPLPVVEVAFTPLTHAPMETSAPAPIDAGPLREHVAPSPSPLPDPSPDVQHTDIAPPAEHTPEIPAIPATIVAPDAAQPFAPIPAPARNQGLDVSATAQAVRAYPQNAPHAQIETSVVRQVADEIRTTPEGTLEIALTPEELGKIKLSMHSVDNSISITVQTERNDTLDLIRRNTEMLARDLRELGYTQVSFNFNEQRQEKQSDGSGSSGGFHADTAEEPPTPPTARSPSGSLDLRF